MDNSKYLFPTAYCFFLDSISDVIIELTGSITDNSTILQKVFVNIASVAEFMAKNQLLLLPGGFLDVTSRLALQVTRDLNNPGPWEGFDNDE